MCSHGVSMSEAEGDQLWPELPRHVANAYLSHESLVCRDLNGRSRSLRAARCLRLLLHPIRPLCVFHVNGLQKRLRLPLLRSLLHRLRVASLRRRLQWSLRHDRDALHKVLLSTHHASVYLYPLDQSFLPRHISLAHGRRVKIGRQVNTKSAVSALNGYFDSYALSKNHAEIWEEAGQIFIRDVESLHGTFINGERISPARAVSEKCELRNNDIVQFGVDFVDENDEYHHKIAARVFCIFKSEDMQVALRSYNENPQDAVPPDDEGLQAPLHPDNADLQGSLPSEDAAVSPGVGPSPASTEDVRPIYIIRRITGCNRSTFSVRGATTSHTSVRVF
ncbi:hypothetical protein PTI98_004140 [Pleurotus ostreatus]|nr:hypothetical protein PTI98_004140 [Pleurotus ostreatus]